MGKPRKTSIQSFGNGNRLKQTNDSDLLESNENDEDAIDTFYQERDENLRTALSKTTKKKSSINKKSVTWALNDDDEENGQDEVLAFDDDDSMASDDNEYQQIEDDEDLSGSWGSSRKMFYNEDANIDDEDAKLEEQEAVQIQKKYYDMLEKKDFGLDLFQQKPSINQNLNEELLQQHHIILPDNLLQLNSNERLQLIRDQSPELEFLCNEFKTIFDDIKIYLLPLIQLVIDTSSIEEFQLYSGWQFILSIFELYLTYCSYLSLYLMMKSIDFNFLKHPILNDIEQYRKLCLLINDDFQFIKNDLLKLCELLQEKKIQLNQKEKNLISKPHLIINNHQISLAINEINSKPSLRERMMKRKEEKQIEIQSEEDKPQKRGITYEIEKNKGLTVKRKKEYRNPRVRNRNKYARALIKRKSRVPTARNEEEKYIGEPTGIRAGIKRGIKLKT